VSEGHARSHHNIFAGRDFLLPDGDRVESRPNIFGGEDYSGPGGWTPLSPITLCRVSLAS